MVEPEAAQTRVVQPVETDVVRKEKVQQSTDREMLISADHLEKADRIPAGIPVAEAEVSMEAAEATKAIHGMMMMTLAVAEDRDLLLHP